MASISELSSEANSYRFTPEVSFASWLHVCQTLQRESRIYDAEDQDLERAYVLYLRFADLVLNKLRTHPDFPRFKRQYARVYNQLPAAIEHSEALKKRILARRAAAPLPHKPQQPPPPRPLTLEEELEHYANHTDDTPAIQFDPGALRVSKPPVPKPPMSGSPLPVNVPRYPTLQYPSLQPQRSPQSGVLSVPTPIPDSAPRSIVSSVQNEHGETLRYIFVPRTLRERFLALAQPNTDANLETCGMLCGKLERNAFFITDLVIPHQTATADTCTTTNEEELFTYVDERDLFLVGWIHTHPSQTCFMSSVDLHTHASYQLMLPEAVAVVCAPSSQPSWAAFRLTDPPGIPVIRACTESGFHPHDDADALYKKASLEHYKEIDAGLTTSDLRAQ